MATEIEPSSDESEREEATSGGSWGGGGTGGDGTLTPPGFGAPTGPVAGRQSGVSSVVTEPPRGGDGGTAGEGSPSGNAPGSAADWWGGPTLLAASGEPPSGGDSGTVLPEFVLSQLDSFFTGLEWLDELWNPSGGLSDWLDDLWHPPSDLSDWPWH